MHYQYQHGVIGGTFVRLHIGHQHLLTSAFTQSERVTIGLTLPQLYQQKTLSSHIESYSLRQENLLKFLKKNNWQQRSKIFPLKDIYGTTLTDQSIDALFVTSQTEKNAIAIQNERQKRGLPHIEVVRVPLLKSEDGRILSSESIRMGTNDVSGHSYSLFFNRKNNYTLPLHLREELRKPLGTHIASLDELPQKNAFFTTIGDITTITLLKAQISPAVAIIDLKTKRESLNEELISTYFHSPTPLFLNPAGTINTISAFLYQQAVKDYLSTQKTQYIVVEGEEDLLALPAILLAPLDSYVLYGQPEIGIMMIKITQQEKENAKRLLTQF